MELQKYTVTLFIFTEEDGLGIEYDLDANEVQTLYNSINSDLTLLPFGKNFHHKDDIIRFIVTEVE